MPSLKFPFHSTYCSKQITTEGFQDGRHGGHHGQDSDGDVENVKLLTDILMRDGLWSTDHGIS